MLLSSDVFLKENKYSFLLFVQIQCIGMEVNADKRNIFYKQWRKNYCFSEKSEKFLKICTFYGNLLLVHANETSAKYAYNENRHTLKPG